MRLSLLFQIAFVNGAALRRVLEAPPISGPIVAHRLEESSATAPNPSDATFISIHSRARSCESRSGPANISSEFLPRTDCDVEELSVDEFAVTDSTSDTSIDNDENQIFEREAESPIPPYPVDNPGKPLKQRPDQLISPSQGFSQRYFNTSNYSPWRPSHDKARPEDRLDWRQPRQSAYCILGGIGKRQTFWQPPLVEDFFNLYHQHDNPETNDRFPEDTRYNNGHDFQYFFNTDSDTNMTKAYSMFITAEEVRRPSKFKQKNFMDANIYASTEAKKRLENCRQDCATCWDAAQETGAEQFICNREEDNDDNGNTGGGGYCRMAMVLGDAVGRARICQMTHGRNRFCTDRPDFTENYAQDGAVPNRLPSLVCDSIRPCSPGACQVDKDTRLLAQGAACRMLGYFAGHADKGARLPRWGMLGYESLAQAMNDASLQVYYQDFTPHPTGAEKAWVLDNHQAFGPDKAKNQYGKWWTDYKAGDPVPKGWTPTAAFPTADHYYEKAIGFGSVPGGFDLKTDEWANALIANLSAIDGWRREHRANRNGQGMDGKAFRYKPDGDDYQWRV